MRRRLVLSVCFLLFSASYVQADFYRWVDKDGNEFYANDRAQIPQEYRDRATAVRPDDARVSVGSTTPEPRADVREHRDRNGHGEEYWRKRAANLRIKLRKQQDEYDLVLRQIDDQDQPPKHLPHKKKKSRTSLEKKKAKLEKEMVQTRRELEVTLPDEARKADAYPGWIRE